jgi:hypothetical protein
VEDDWDIEAAARQLDRTGAAVTSRPACGGVRGGTSCRGGGGVEDGRGVEVAVCWLDQTEAGVTGRSRHGGDWGGADCRGGGGVDEPATLGCSWTGAVCGQTSQIGGERVPVLEVGAAAAIDLSEWAWTWGRVGCA